MDHFTDSLGDSDTRLRIQLSRSKTLDETTRLAVERKSKEDLSMTELFGISTQLKRKAKNLNDTEVILTGSVSRVEN